MASPASPRPAGIVVSVTTTAVLAVFFLVMAVLSLSSGHGSLSAGVAVALVVWGLLVGVSAVLLWQGAAWSRGPVVAAGLLHVFAFGQLAVSAPLAVAGALAGAAAVAGAVLPSSRAWLTRPRTPRT
ncbi:MAG: hypothetical protein QM708_16055 [Propioniciclava sp.]|uniref:hypothetical protein n=1 Tax=Propioniciclava sp. TaxID=2038686 RepID=UPI0039E6B551